MLGTSNQKHPFSQEFITFFPALKVIQKQQLRPIYCLQDGWTVIQSRGQFGNPTDYFNKTWAEHRAGFGTPCIREKFFNLNLACQF